MSKCEGIVMLLTLRAEWRSILVVKRKRAPPQPPTMGENRKGKTMYADFALDPEATTYKDPYLRRCQVAYLHHQGYSAKHIAFYSGYVVGTVYSYIKRFYDKYIDDAIQLFSETVEATKESVIELLKDTKRKIAEAIERERKQREERIARKKKFQKELHANPDYDFTSKSTATSKRENDANYEDVYDYYRTVPRENAFVYLVSFYNHKSGERFFKVGTTTRNPHDRMKEKLKQAGKCGHGPARAWDYHIDALFSIPPIYNPLYLETFFRNLYHSMPDARMVGNDSMVHVWFGDIDITTDARVQSLIQKMETQMMVF